MLFFRKILRTYLMDDPLAFEKLAWLLESLLLRNVVCGTEFSQK